MSGTAIIGMATLGPTVGTSVEMTEGALLAGAAQIPTNPASILAYLLLVGFVVLIWYGNRKAKQGGDADRGDMGEDR